jgi:UDP-glucose 4-epimerase
MTIDSTRWAGHSVLVTGATGFVGRTVVPRLVDAGAQVHATSRTPPPQSSAVHWITLDLDDVDALRATVRGIRPDVVLHLGGRVSGAVDPGLVAPTFRSLLASSVALLSAAQSGDVGRLVLVGTTDEPRAGEVPASPYSAAKGAMTAYAKLFAEAFSAPVISVRPAETFGPGQSAGKLLPYTAATVLRGEIPQLSSGRRRGDWVYIDDVVDGLLEATANAPDGADLDLGTGVLRTNREVVEELLRALGSDVVPNWGALPDRPTEPEHAADVEHTAAVLGWRARVSLQDGLRRTAAAARASAPFPPGRRVA